MPSRLNDRLLNGLALGHASGAVGALSRLHVAVAFFGITIVPSFLGHLKSKNPKAQSCFPWQTLVVHLGLLRALVGCAYVSFCNL